MARVTVETVEHVARLARLSLSDEERVVFARQLDEILSWAESLQDLDVEGIPPMAHELAPEWRPDEPHQGTSREQALGESGDARDGLFRVPRVIG